MNTKRWYGPAVGIMIAVAVVYGWRDGLSLKGGANGSAENYVHPIEFLEEETPAESTWAGMREHLQYMPPLPPGAMGVYLMDGTFVPRTYFERPVVSRWLNPNKGVVLPE